MIFKLSILLCGAILIASTAADLAVLSHDLPSAPLPTNGAAVDEVVVESSLYIKPKAKQVNVRKTRSIIPIASLLDHKRVKRHPQYFGPAAYQQPFYQQQPQYSQSQAASNAAANNHYHNPFGGFGSSAANAQAQAFNAQGPAGGFGASSSGTQTQALNANRFGQFQNSAGASMAQTYTLPNGQTINFASTNSLANGFGNNNANSRGAAVSVSDG